MEANSIKFRKPTVIIFDVYETLLNMYEIERKMNQLLDNRHGYLIWFEQFMQYCFVDNCTVQFNDFTTIARATMQMTAKMLGRKVDGHDFDFVLELLKHLPVQEGVQEGLSSLRNQQFRIAALTNSPYRTVIERMEKTGLVSYFEKILSAENVKKYKPCREVYDWASSQLHVTNEDVMLVSAHGWDIAGAANAGMFTVYLQQSKQPLYPLAPQPRLNCSSVEDLARQLQQLFED